MDDNVPPVPVKSFAPPQPDATWGGWIGENQAEGKSSVLKYIFQVAVLYLVALFRRLVAVASYKTDLFGCNQVEIFKK